MNFLHPFRRLYWSIRKYYMEYLMYHNPKKLKDILYYKKFHNNINWKDPKDLNEKINWLSFNTDTSLWTKCADKYRVREYIKECGCEEILVQLYGVWEKAENIDFDALPNKFVLKTNHGCGGIIIVRDKSVIDRESIIKRLQRNLDTPFGWELAEPHYLNIKPCIICEELLEDGAHAHPVDYKVWCFNGEPCYIWTTSDRVIETHELNGNLFDTEWHRLNHFMSEKFRNNVDVAKPKNLKGMLDYAKRLSQPFPQVRCDLYEIQGKIYFGELTFTSRAGLIGDYTQEALRIMGDKITLPLATK